MLWFKKKKEIITALNHLTEECDKLSKHIDQMESIMVAKDQENIKMFMQLMQLNNEIINNVDKSEINIKNLINANDDYILNTFIPMVETYMDGEVSRLQGILDKTDDYQYYKTIHDLLRMYKSDATSFKRVGRENDGGYIMATPISENKIAYSLGICDDVSWDTDMANMGYEIFQYDHTIDSLPEQNKAFHWSRIGLTGEEETNELKHLDTILKMNGHNNTTGMVLKMDIEGFEWGVINQSSESTLERFDQIVMEIHNLISTNDRECILSALKKISKTHALVHIHANNYRPRKIVYGDLITSDVVEVTMLNRKKYNLIESQIIVPTNMDQKNDPNIKDTYLGKW